MAQRVIAPVVFSGPVLATSRSRDIVGADREDIAMLAEYFVRKQSNDCKVRPKPISREAMSRLVEYDWPGNVRELENAIERALVMSVSDEIRPEDLPETVLEKATDSEIEEGKYHAAVEDLKKQMILDALQQMSQPWPHQE